MSPRNKKAYYVSRQLIERRARSMPAVYCPLCDRWLMTLTKVHAEKHGLTQKEFCLEYPEVCDVFFWGDINTATTRARFTNWRKLAESKKDPPEGGPSDEGQG